MAVSYHLLVSHSARPARLPPLPARRPFVLSRAPLSPKRVRCASARFRVLGAVVLGQPAEKALAYPLLQICRLRPGHLPPRAQVLQGSCQGELRDWPLQLCRMRLVARTPGSGKEEQGKGPVCDLHCNVDRGCWRITSSKETGQRLAACDCRGQPICLLLHGKHLAYSSIFRKRESGTLLSIACSGHWENLPSILQRLRTNEGPGQVHSGA